MSDAIPVLIVTDGPNFIELLTQKKYCLIISRLAKISSIPVPNVAGDIWSFGW